MCNKLKTGPCCIANPATAMILRVITSTLAPVSSKALIFPLLPMETVVREHLIEYQTFDLDGRDSEGSSSPIGLIEKRTTVSGAI